MGPRAQFAGDSPRPIYGSRYLGKGGSHRFIGRPFDDAPPRNGGSTVRRSPRAGTTTTNILFFHNLPLPISVAWINKVLSGGMSPPQNRETTNERQNLRY